MVVSKISEANQGELCDSQEVLILKLVIDCPCGNKQMLIGRIMMISTSNHMSGRAIWDKLLEFIFAYFYFFSSIWVFFHEHSQITGLQGKKEGISLTPSATSTRFTDIQILPRRLLQRAHLCAQLAAGLEPGTFGFRAQPAKTVNYIKLTNFLF